MIRRRVRLSDVTGPDQTALSDDLGQIRWAMWRLGLYDSAEDSSPWGDERMSRGLHTAITELQDHQGLRRDGLLRPGGPTESRLNFLLALDDDPSMHSDLHDINGRLVPERLAAFEAAKRRETAPGVLAGRVGPGLENHPLDVRAAKTLLARQGLLPEAELGEAIGRPGSAGSRIKSGIAETRPSEALFEALGRFQQQAGLTTDGMMAPDGETERALRLPPRVQPAPATGKSRTPALGLPPAPVPQAIRELLQPTAVETGPVPSVLFDLARPSGLGTAGRPPSGTDPLQALLGPSGRPSPSDGPQLVPARKVPPLPEPKPRRVPPPPPRKPRPAGQPLARPGFLEAPNLGAPTRQEGLKLAERLAGMPVPGYKSQYRPGALPFELGRWGYELDQAGIKGYARRAFLETFAAEGGFTRAKGSETYAGITQGALKDASTRAGITADSKPRDLNPEELARVYRGFMRQSSYLGRVGGLEALDSLRDAKVAAALFDTLFRNGNRGGGNAIRKAINTIGPGSVAPSGDHDTDTFEAYRDLTGNCGTRQELLDALAEERKKQYSTPGDKARFDHFRFRNSSECRDVG